MSKAWNPPSSQPILIYFEFRNKPSLITVICMEPHSPNKLIATKYCFLILGDEFLFLNHFFFFRFFFVIWCYFVIINFYKNYVIIIILFNFFFSWKLLLFFHVSGSSGMFRPVPECSMFLVLSTPPSVYIAHWYLWTKQNWDAMIMNSKFEPEIIEHKSTCRAYWQWKVNTLTSHRENKGAQGIN